MLTDLLRILALSLLASLAACSGFAPYRIEIQQGNYISAEMAGQLKPGMSKQQVRFVLGTPLLIDVFHGERWDYVYYLDARQGKVEQRRLAVHFADGKLTRLDGDLAQAAAQPIERTP